MDQKRQSKDVLNHYKKGGEAHDLKDKRITSFTLTENQEVDLLEFFATLVDTSYMVNFK